MKYLQPASLKYFENINPEYSSNQTCDDEDDDFEIQSYEIVESDNSSGEEENLVQKSYR